VRVASVFHHVADFCYPGACANCEAPAAGGAMLCDPCAAELDHLAAAGACDRCGMPLSVDGAPCPYCHGRGLAPYERLLRLGIFDDPLRHLIHRFKYHRRWTLGEMLADRLCATERAKGLLSETEVLVPVPLHFVRHFQRGYNQAEVLARRIGSRKNSHGIAVVHAVRRTRNTETQTHLHSMEKRRANVRGAFALRRRAARRLRGRHVLVVDDVMTTGATLKSVGHLLKQAKPASLCAVVLAVADPKGRGFEAI
jgi:ComF family protein